MTKITRHNIYLKSKFFIINIYHILNKSKNIFIIFSLITYILVYNNNTKGNIRNHKKLAFNTYLLDFVKINKSIINIQITEYNQNFFSKILPKYKYKTLKNIYKINIVKILECLRNIGILKKIDYFTINIHNFKYWIINIYINPIIKRIEIDKYKYLKIPTKFLIDILKYQLGFPVNYHEINNSIHKIHSWYINKGFAYIYIKLRHKKNSQILYLQIFEGQIINNCFICKSKNVFNSFLINNIESILIQELGISKGSILNIKKIEQGIKYLKKIRLISNCEYSIKQYKKGLYLKIQYSIFINNYGYIYSQNLIFKNLQDFLLLYILNQNILKISLPKFTEALQKLAKISQNSSSKIKLKNNFEEISPSTYLNFKYDFSYLNSNCKFYIQSIKKLPKFKFLIFLPYIEIQNNIFNFIKLNFYQKLYKIKTLYPTYNNQIGYFYSRKKIIFRVYIKSKGSIISLNHNIYKKIKCKQNYMQIYNLCITRFLNIKKYYFSRSLQNKKVKFKMYQKFIKQQLLLLNIQIKYNNFEYAKFLQSGKLLTLEFLLFKPRKIISLDNLYNYGDNNIKLRYYQTFLLPNYLHYIKKNALKIFTEINCFAIANNYGKILNNINDKYLQIYFQNRYKRIVKYYSKYSYKIEYHISIYNFFSYYIFTDIHSKLYYINEICNYNYITGLGIQINIPIKAIPKIRFEYRISKFNRYHYQLRLFSSYINYNN
nr:hypothetical protein [Calliblepharis sp.]